MIDFGMPTLTETVTINECAKLCYKLGLQFIELNMNLPQYQLDAIDIYNFKEIAEQFEIYYTIHLDENLNISDFNSYVAKAYYQTVLQTIKIAKELSVPVLNMHLSRGVYFTLPNKKVYLFDEYKEQYLKSIISFRNECEKEIGNNNIKICIENCSGYTDFQIEALNILLQSPIFSLTFDTGHNHCTGGTDEEIIMKYPNKLCHMHIHDAIRDMKKDHLSLGDGELDLHKYLNIAKTHNCRVVLETKTIAGLEESVWWVKKSGLI